jgi:RNA polymerase sigma-70 factor (ECF subfamily)
VNSALARARAQLEVVAPAEDDPAGPLDPRHRELLDRYATAFDNADIDALVEMVLRALG